MDEESSARELGVVRAGWMLWSWTESWACRLVRLVTTLEVTKRAYLWVYVFCSYHSKQSVCDPLNSWSCWVVASRTDISTAQNQICISPYAALTGAVWDFSLLIIIMGTSSKLRQKESSTFRINWSIRPGLVTQVLYNRGDRTGHCRKEGLMPITIYLGLQS